MSMKKFFLLNCALVSIYASKAQFTDSTNHTLQQVTITSNKFPQKLSETGKVITVIGKEVLERSVGKDLAQLLNEQAGLIINGANNNSAKDKSVFLWGASNTYTLILVDGIPLYDAASVGGAFDLRMFPIDQIERIEILKGAQSTLYGTDAVAGVINIITKKNSNKPISVSSMFAYGSYNTKRGNINISGKKSILDYNINYQRLATDGISEALDTTGKANYDKDGYFEQALQAKLGLHLMPTLTINPFFQYTQFNGKYDIDAFTDDNSRFKSKLISSGTQVHFDDKKWIAVGLYNYQQLRREYISMYAAKYDGRFQHIEGYTTYNTSKHIQILGGLTTQDYKLVDTTTKIKNPNFNITSAYLAVYLKALNGFNIELGGRYNHHSKYGDVFTYSFNPSYYFTKNIKGFLNIASGYKAPSLQQLYGAFGANPNLKPELANTLEGGLAAGFLKNKIHIRITGFYRNIKDVIVYENNKYNNRDKQKDYGVEIATNIHPTKNLSVNINYTYINGNVYTKTFAGKDTSYFNLIRRPKNNINLNVGYQINKKWYANASMHWMDKRNDLYFNPVTFNNDPIVLKSYVLFNVYTSYNFYKYFKVFIDVKNIFNAKYTEVYGYNILGTNAQAGIQFSL